MKNRSYIRTIFFLSAMILGYNVLFGMETIKSTKKEIYAKIQNINRHNLPDSIIYTAFLPANELIHAQYFTKGAAKGTFFCYLVKENKKQIKLDSDVFKIIHASYMENKRFNETSK